MTLAIRPASPADLPLIAALIRDLAEYEKLASEVRFDAAVLGEKLFGPRPYAEVLIGEIDAEPQGFALFFHNFSTFEGRPGIYLEDLFVRPAARGAGLGKALLAHLAALTVERDCARLEWSVLDWNEPAIGFYKKLGARLMDEWTVMRVDGSTLAQLATEAHATTDSLWNPVKHGVIHKRL
jgi:GNAT superfamily N-acetyltransferase